VIHVCVLLLDIHIPTGLHYKHEKANHSFHNSTKTEHVQNVCEWLQDVLLTPDKWTM